MAQGRTTGTIVRVFLPRGFAFVRGDDGRDYMLQADELSGEWSGERVREGARVEFRPRENDKAPGKWRAAEARAV